MGRPAGSKNKVRIPRPLTVAMADELERRRRQMARLRWWERNRPPGY